jgi:hypothetical protein
MDQLDLTPEDIQQIILVSRRYLVNENTHPDDLRAALLERLGGGRTALAGKIRQMDETQMTALSRSIIAQQPLPAHASVPSR